MVAHVAVLKYRRWACATIFGIGLIVVADIIVRTSALTFRNSTSLPVEVSVSLSNSDRIETRGRRFLPNSTSTFFFVREHGRRERDFDILVRTERESFRTNCGYIDASPTHVAATVSLHDSHLEVACRSGGLAL